MNKLFFLLLLMPALLFAATWNGTADSLWYTSNKNAATYTITTAEQLAGLAAVVNRGITFEGKTIMLGANIVLNDTNDYYEDWWQQWTPIGNESNRFRGNFDGNGKVITGLYINSNSSYQGFFGYAEQASISNLGLASFYIEGYSHVGGIVGYCRSYYLVGCSISNSYAIGNVKGTYSYVGGITGYGGTVEISYFAGTVAISGSSSNERGGIYGYNGSATSSFYDSNIAGNLPNGIPRNTKYMQDSLCLVLRLYASDANKNYIDWKCNNGGYPSFSGAKVNSNILSNYFASGAGTSADPYIINTKKQLEDFSALTNLGYTFQDKYIKLGANITLNDTNARGGWRSWNDATTGLQQWIPIGNNSNRFRGNFDGNGKVITGLYINSTDNYKGLFGYTEANYIAIHNLGLVGFYVKGGEYVGSIVGICGGTSYNYFNLVNSYAIGNVKGSNYVGGILGSILGNNSNVNNTYFAGNIIGNNKGGIVGSNITTSNSFYDSSIAGNLSNGIPKNTKYMQDSLCHILHIYAVGLNGNSYNNNYGWKCNALNYPSFSETKANNAANYFASGTGTSTDPYIINTKKQLEDFSTIANLGSAFDHKYVKLGANIVLNDTNARGGWRTWDSTTTGLESWTPINFTGNFDGNGKVIVGLYGKSLFHAKDGEGGALTINNLGLTGFYTYTGSIVDMASNNTNVSISNSYAIGNVIGDTYAGGLIGNSSGWINISNSYVIGNVISNNGNAGGLIGNNNGTSTIVNSYVIGDVIGSNAGGLIGYNNTITMDNSYVIGNVIGNNHVGGLIGSTNIKSTITNSFITGNVISNNVAGGIVGNNSANNFTISNSYVMGDVTGNWAVGGVIGVAYNEVSIANIYVKGNLNLNNNNANAGGGVGGIVGYCYSGISTIANVYFIGDINTNSSKTDGIIGYGSGNVSNSFYNSNLTSSNYGISKTSEEMKNILTYIEGGWDFDYIWAINSGVGYDYPFLQNSIYYTQGKKRIADASNIPNMVEKYTGLPIEPAVDSVMYNGTKLTKGTDYDLLYHNNVIADGNAKIIIIGKGNYYGAKTVNFHITDKQRNIADVVIDPIIPEQITGNSIEPKPVVKDFNNTATLREGKDYALEYYENKYAGQAIIKISGLGAYEDSRTINFSIVGRIPLTVQWSEEREFVYNKMVQVPTASIDRDDIQWRVVNARSEAGTYTDANKLAPFVLITSANANSFELLNNTVNYEIKKRPLNPYFKAPSILSNFASNTDTLWVPRKTFTDSSALQNILESIVSYEGFAQDTLTKEKDDISVLKNTPTISLDYAPSPVAQKMLAKRVETTQTAVAVINTDNVSADNYSLSKRNIMIMETVEDEEGAERVFCFLGNYCTELSEEVCTFIKGEEVASCNSIRKSCQIGEDICVNNMLLGECNSIGGTVLKTPCEGTPVKQLSLASNAFRVWQTASGVVNMDLGYMPIEPIAVQVYDLKGKLIAREQVGTRFATITFNAGGGIYLFKVGNRNLIKAIK
jgi:hypothetical protein